MCPLVIDSPRQQDQDSSSWQKICEAIRDERPEGTQLILAVVEDSGVGFGGEILDLDTPGYVLREDEYEDAKAEIMPLMESALGE